MGNTKPHCGWWSQPLCCEWSSDTLCLSWWGPLPPQLRVSLQSILNRIHVVSIPYALMKVNPLSWIQKVCVYKGNRGTSSVCVPFLREVFELIFGD